MGRRLLRAGKWAVFSLGAALALSPLAVMVAARRAETRLDRTLRELAASGAPVELAQLAKPPIPDAENAALVYQRAFPLIHLSDQDKDLIARIAFEPSGLSDQTMAAKAGDLRHRNAAALRLILQATTMPRCDFRPDWGKGYDLLFPDIGKLRSSCYLLALESAMLLHAGRTDDAVEACAAGLRVAAAADDPTLIAELTKYAILAIASKTLVAVLGESTPSERVCRSVAAEIARTDLIASHVDTVKAERAWGLWGFNLVRSARNPVRAADELSGSEPGWRYVPHRPLKNPPQHPRFVNWWLASDELAYLELMARAVEQAPLPYREVVRIRPSIEEQLESESPVRWPPHILTVILMPVFPDAQRPRDRAIASLGLDQLALLLKAYHARRGEYPESLTELAAYAGRALPEDPFSGKPFAYRREGDGFVVYSWGPNLKDDGGTPSPKDSPGEGDLVIRCVR